MKVSTWLLALLLKFRFQGGFADSFASFVAGMASSSAQRELSRIEATPLNVSTVMTTESFTEQHLSVANFLRFDPTPTLMRRLISSQSNS